MITIIAAMSLNGIIGRDGDLPWRLSNDLVRFKRLTSNSTIVMGRRTFESLPCVLPRRRHIVISSRGLKSGFPEVIYVTSLEEALNLCDNAFLIGGERVFKQGLEVADELLLTIVEAHIEGDVRFPPVDWDRWKLRHTERTEVDEKNQYPTLFRIYERHVPPLAPLQFGNPGI